MPWAPDYLTLTQARDYLRIAPGDTSDDAYLADLVTATSRAIDALCRRQFGTAVQTRTYRAVDAVQLLDGSGWVLACDDVADPAAATVSCGGAAVFPRWWPDNALADAVPATAMVFGAPPGADVDVAAPFGWPAVPAAVGSACRLQLGRWWIRRESPYGTGGSPGEGGEVSLAARVDPDVATMLSGLARPRATG